VLTLTAVLQLRDRHGVVRLPQQAMTALDARDGTVLRMRGARTTAAIAVTGDGPPGSVLCDELVLSNLRLRDGDPVEVEVAPARRGGPADRHGPAAVVRSLDPGVLRTACSARSSRPATRCRCGRATSRRRSTSRGCAGS
jgi:transitional endoplasmic reticulum ATPase